MSLEAEKLGKIFSARGIRLALGASNISATDSSAKFGNCLSDQFGEPIIDEPVIMLRIQNLIVRIQAADYVDRDQVPVDRRSVRNKGTVH